MMSRFTNTIPSILAALLLCTLAGAALWAQGTTRRLARHLEADDDIYYLPPATWLRAFTCGYTETAAHLVWIKAILYFVDTTANPRDKTADLTRRSHTARYIEVLTRLSPRYLKAYTQGATMVKLHRGRITRASLDRSVAILEAGMAAFPGHGGIAFDLGFTYYSDYPAVTTNPKEAAHYRRRGIDLIRKASFMPHAPPYLASLSAKLLYEEGLDDLVIRHLQAQLMAETDPDIRRTLKVQLERSLGEQAQEDIAATERVFHTWKHRYDYIPFEFYLLIHPGTTRDAASTGTDSLL